jgi:Mycobacterial 4 TMS phage holin, superfamily IV
MIRLLLRLALTIVGNAIGLLVAGAVLDDMDMNASGFLIALLIFTVAEAVLQPLITKIALQNAEALQGGTALVTTFLALLITDLVSDGLNIEGGVTWLLATLIVWLVTMLAGVILAAIFLKNVAEDRK